RTRREFVPLGGGTGAGRRLLDRADRSGGGRRSGPAPEEGHAGRRRGAPGAVLGTSGDRPRRRRGRRDVSTACTARVGDPPRLRSSVVCDLAARTAPDALPVVGAANVAAVARGRPDARAHRNAGARG